MTASDGLSKPNGPTAQLSKLIPLRVTSRPRVGYKLNPSVGCENGTILLSPSVSPEFFEPITRMLSIAPGSYDLSISDNSRLVRDARELLQNLFTVDGH